jgi:hypothetical protein
MIDTNKIAGRFKIRPVNFGGEESRHTSEYEELKKLKRLRLRIVRR